MRCAQCESVFRVRPPARAPAAPPAAPPAATREPVADAPPPAARPSPPPASALSSEPGNAAPEDLPPRPEAERSRLVLMAHPEVEEGKRVADALRSWGLEVILVHDGVEAILGIQRSLPRIVVLDAALTKMFGFQVCELVKRNESLREIKVVLVGAIHNQDRYRRRPGDLYGADAYVERQDLPEALAPLLRDLRIAGSGGDAPAQAAQPAAPQEPAPAAPAIDPSLAPELAKAERLARIIVSDIVLYNADKFESALLQGDPVRAMSDELREGRDLLARRVDPRITDHEGLLARELVRVARERGMG
jgi:CheY-like chemotaxis protein